MLNPYFYTYDNDSLNILVNNPNYSVKICTYNYYINNYNLFT